MAEVGRAMHNGIGRKAVRVAVNVRFLVFDQRGADVVRNSIERLSCMPFYPKYTGVAWARL